MSNSHEQEDQDIMDCVNWSPNYPLMSPYQQREPEFNLLEELNQPQSEEPFPFKTKYIKKNDLSSQNHKKTMKLKKDGPQSSTFPQQDTQKKIKNKVASKKSRDKKKFRVQIVEQSNKAMQAQLEKINTEIDDYKSEILKATFTSPLNIGGPMVAKINHAVKKLKKLVCEEEKEQIDNQINLTVDSICYQMEAMGKERQSNLKQGYREIKNNGIPAMSQYMLWAAENHHHLFSRAQSDPNSEQQAWFKQMKELLKDSLQNTQLQSLGAQITSTKKDILEVFQKLHKAQKHMEHICSKLDLLFLRVRQIMNPLQLAKFFLFQETYRYWQEICFPQRIWLQEVNKNTNEHPTIQHTKQQL